MIDHPRFKELAAILGYEPRELTEYFAIMSKEPLKTIGKRNDINLLDVDDVIDKSIAFNFHPVIRALGGICLDDSDTSNHHFYLTAPAVRGSILYLCHDDDTRIVYTSMHEFLSAVQASVDDDYFEWDDVHPPASPMLAGQKVLCELAKSAYREGQIETLLAIIPSMDMIENDQVMLRRFATDSDFFITEAIANAIYMRPSPALQILATLCASHKHQQAATAGHNALLAIAKQGEAHFRK